jgi:hypothetical protein
MKSPLFPREIQISDPIISAVLERKPFTMYYASLCLLRAFSRGTTSLLLTDLREIDRVSEFLRGHDTDFSYPSGMDMYPSTPIESTKDFRNWNPWATTQTTVVSSGPRIRTAERTSPRMPPHWNLMSPTRITFV